MGYASREIGTYLTLQQLMQGPTPQRVRHDSQEGTLLEPSGYKSPFRDTTTRI